MRHLYILIIIFFAQTISYAQTGHPDFSNQIAKSVTDSQKLEAYHRVFNFFKNSDNDSAIAYLEPGVELFTQHKYPQGKAALLSMLSGLYNEKGLPQAAKNAGEEALNIFTSLNDHAGVAKTHNSLGVMEGRKGNYDAAIKHFLTALKYFESISDTANIINTYVKLGAANDYCGNFDKGLAYAKKALNMSLLTKESGNTIHLYNNIGIAYARKEMNDTAFEYFKKALTLSNKPKYAEIRVSPLMNIGKLYENMGNEHKALDCYIEALTLAKAKDMPDECVQLLTYIGAMQNRTNPKKAMQSMQEALKIAEKTENKHLQAEVLTEMADIAEANGNYKDEVAYLKQERIIHDSIFNIEKVKEIANLQAEYDLNKSNKQLAALKLAEQKNLQKKNMIIAAVIVLALSLLTLLFLFIRGRQLNTELSRREQELQKANDVKDRLFSILGHDLKGPIGNIPVLLDIYNSKDTSEEEKQFIMDSLRENSAASIETLDKLLDWGKLQIKGVRLSQSVINVPDIIASKLKLLKVATTNKNITIVNNVPPDTQAYVDENHFKFIVRNLISNAIKYTNPGGSIEINAQKHSNERYITFSVSDNGVGMTADRQKHIFEPYNESISGTANEAGNSIGLMLCKEFVLQNGGEIWVKSEEGRGTTIYFSVLAVRLNS